MVATPETWRCPVCEGVNRGGRTCTTCGETLPAGFTPIDAARPAPAPPGPRVVPATRRPAGTRTPSPTEIFGSDPFR